MTASSIVSERPRSRASRFQQTAFPRSAGNTTTNITDTFADKPRFNRAQRAPVSSAAETTTITNTAAHQVRASRFQRPSFSANGTTTFTNTKISRGSCPDPVSSLPCQCLDFT